MGVDKQPETFAELVESWKLQPYQQEFVDRIWGVPVEIVPDPFDDKVGYILNLALVRQPLLFISTPEPTSIYDDIKESLRKLDENPPWLRYWTSIAD